MIAHESTGQRELLPLAEAHLNTAGPGRSQLRLQSGSEAFQHILGSGAVYGRHHRRLVFKPGNVADAYGMARAEFETKEVLERAGETRSPFVGRDPREIQSVDQNAPLVGLVEAAQQLHERALAGAVLSDNGHHRTGLQLQADIVQ